MNSESRDIEGLTSLMCHLIFENGTTLQCDKPATLQDDESLSRLSLNGERFLRTVHSHHSFDRRIAHKEKSNTPNNSKQLALFREETRSQQPFGNWHFFRGDASSLCFVHWQRIRFRRIWLSRNVVCWWFWTQISGENFASLLILKVLTLLFLSTFIQLRKFWSLLDCRLLRCHWWRLWTWRTPPGNLK